MKNIITVAALLAAGTAFANAGILEESIVFSIDGTTGTSWTGVSDKTNNITASANTLSLNGTNSWEFSFDVVANATAMNSYGTALIATGTNNALAGEYKPGFQIYWAKGGKLYAKVNANESGKGTFTDGSSSSLAYAPDEGTVNLTVAAQYTVGDAGNSITLKVISGEKTYSYTKSSVGALSMENLCSALGNGWTASNLAGKVYSNIPEPSAFGLLAGAGALALVAARRRRRKA